MSYKNRARSIGDLERGNLVEYFINKYSNTGKNIGPTVADIPNSEVEDYRLVFNDDGTIIGSSSNAESIDDISEFDIDGVLDSIRKNSTCIMLGTL